MNRNINQLNKEYTEITVEERISRIFTSFPRVLVTSSFGTTSALLLKLISLYGKADSIFFLDTTYHFKETLEYRDKLSLLLNLKVKVIRAEKWKSDFTLSDETWKKDPDLCCSINKVEPLENILSSYDVWISGLMKWQSPFRNQLDLFVEKENITRFYPMLDLPKEKAEKYLREFNLPEHPLHSRGYSSVGCVHCTEKGKEREGRWINKSKTECGLHK